MTTSYTLEEVLGYVALTGTIQATTTGIPNPLPNGFMNIKKPTIGDSARYTRVTGTRRTAHLSMYGAPARKRELKDIGYVDVKLMHTLEEVTLNPLVLQQLRNYNNYDVQRQGMEEVARQTAEFAQYFMNLRTASTLSMLALGAIYFDSDYNLLPTSSGAQTTISFQVPSTNQGQLPALTGGGSILTSGWQNADADIPSMIRLLKKQARRSTGYPVKYAFYGENVPSYITNNDYCTDYLARNPRFNEEWTNTGEIPDLFNLVWVPVYETFYEDQNGAFQSFFTADTVVFTPEVSADWYEMIEGTYEVPTTLNIVTDANAAMQSLTQVTGMFAYGAVTHNPPTINMYKGDTFLPVLKVPNSIWQAVVNF